MNRNVTHHPCIPRGKPNLRTTECQEDPLSNQTSIVSLPRVYFTSACGRRKNAVPHPLSLDKLVEAALFLTETTNSRSPIIQHGENSFDWSRKSGKCEYVLLEQIANVANSVRINKRLSGIFAIKHRDGHSPHTLP